MTKEALKLAMEALNDMACWKEGREVDMGFDEPYAADTSRKALTAIDQALANDALEKKAENARKLGLDYEPVAWMCKRDDGNFDVLTDQTCKKCFPVYTKDQL